MARITSGAAVLGLAVLSTNVLDTHDRGIYAILSTWAGIANSIITGGTPVLAADLIHRRHEEPVLHGASFVIAIQSALALVPVAVAVAFLTSGATLAALVCTAAVAVLVTYSSYEMSIAQARGDVRRVSLTDIGISLFPLIVTAASVAIFDPTVTTLMTAWALGAAIMATLQLTNALAAGKLVLRHAWRVAASITRRSLAVALANGTALLCSRIDVLVVAAVLSASAAGIYSIPVALASSLLLLSRSLLTATYHSIMTAPANEVGARLSAALRHRVIVVMAGGCLSVPVVARRRRSVFGDAYSDIWRPYAMLVPASAFICVAEVLRHFLITRLERQREILITSVVMVIVNGILAVVGAARSGSWARRRRPPSPTPRAWRASWGSARDRLSMPVVALAVPRPSDLIAYWRLVRLMATKLRLPRSVP